MPLQLRLTAIRELKEISGRVNLARLPPTTIRTPEITALVLQICIKNTHKMA